MAFVCQQCGNESPRWQGRCFQCGEWNSYVEIAQKPASSLRSVWLEPWQEEPQELAKVSLEESHRLRLPLDEVNRVLGGGIVPGSLVLIAGDPGIGKSTLLLQIAGAVAHEKSKVSYVSGEESAAQVKMRATRLGISGENIYFLGTTDVEEILNYLDSQKPALVMVDSIQTIYANDIPSGAGSVGQLRECARRLTQWAKARNIPLLVTGHVTKGGDMAGPRVLEHMVDVVLYLEGESISSLRLLRSAKNRFGSTNEVGVLEMREQGLVEVDDPSRAFLSEYREGAVGSVIIPTLEGSRPLLVEVQALTSPSMLPAPRRVANGIDFNRLLLISAVLTQRVGLSLSGQDVVVSVAGGLRIGEPAADLGMALAIVSSHRQVPLESSTVAVGEIGLSGEVRQVPQLERRITEVARLGFKRCLVPASSQKNLSSQRGLELVPVTTLAQAMNLAVPKPRRRAARQVTSHHTITSLPSNEE